ncbi:unnamed protein product [Brachionus calyciflorus]|uniref:Uncharacterized protein n=1 Tax=Brachionus calyciflorus TaxID=104777 RepID=A0A813UU54_9BILA|nr:unnamed protein product [Brachionus calyciflorus]
MQTKLIENVVENTSINRPAFILGDLQTRPNSKRIRYTEMTKITSPSSLEINNEYSRPKRLCSVKSTPVLTTDRKDLLETNISSQPIKTSPKSNRTSPTKNRLNKNLSQNDLNKTNKSQTTNNYTRNAFTCLRNLGSTCYINCIIQVMRYTPGFVLSINRLNKQIEYLKSLKNAEIDTEINRNNDISFVKNLHELLADMSKIEQADRRPIYTPRKFVNTVWTLLSFWSDGSQQDAHEFLQYTIHFINECDLCIRKIQQQYQIKNLPTVKEEPQTDPIPIPTIEIRKPVRKTKKTQVEILANPLLIVTDESSSSSSSSICSSSASSTSAVSAPVYQLKPNFLRTPTKGGASSYNLNLLESNLNSKKDPEEELIFRPMIKSDPIISPKITTNKKSSPILIDNNDIVSKRLKETLNSSLNDIKISTEIKRYQANSLNDSDSMIIMDSDGDDEVYFMDDNEVLHPIEKKTPEDLDIKNCFVLLEKIQVENFKATEPKKIEKLTQSEKNQNFKKLRPKSKTFSSEFVENSVKNENIKNEEIFDIDAITSVSTVKSYNSNKNNDSLRKLRSNNSSQNLKQTPMIPLSTPPSPAELLRKFSTGSGYTCEMDKLFKGSSVTVTQCLECENLRKCPESFYDRSIPLETTENEDESSCWIAKCLSNESYLNENSKYMCDQCASKQEAKIQTLYTQMPSILILHLLSYGITSSDDGNLNTRKLSNRLRLVNYFDFMCKKENEYESTKSPVSIKGPKQNLSIKYQFKLFAVVMHSGVSLNSGHYTAFVNYSIICRNINSFDNSLNLKPNMFENEQFKEGIENGSTEWLHFDDTKHKMAMYDINANLNSNYNFFENFEIKVIDQNKNRSLIAKKSFSKGDVLFSERPIVSAQFAWNEFYNYRACEFCMRPLESAQENIRRLCENPSINLPHLKQCCETKKSTHCVCSQCSIEYCSEDCRLQAFNLYHQTLCLGENRRNPSHPFNILMDVWKQIHLPPETTNIYLIFKLIAMMKQTGDKGELMRKLSNFECGLVNEKDQLPHKLLKEKFFTELESLREMTFEIFNRDLYVKDCEPWMSSEGFRQIFALFGRNSQGIGTSPFSIYVENLSEIKNLTKIEKKKLDKFIDKLYGTLENTAGNFLNSEGSGLYEYQSMINHSCKPNAEISFRNNNFELSIVALEDIQMGQEVLISYLDECELNSSRHTRQKMLRENYLFNCQCERCVSEKDQPDVTSDEDEELEEDDGYEDIDEDDEEDMEN